MLYIYLLVLCVCAEWEVPQHEWESQKTTYGDQFSLSIMEGPRIKAKSSGLVEKHSYLLSPLSGSNAPLLAHFLNLFVVSIKLITSNM